MSEKLTKNVSMSSGEVTTEVILAAFEELLQRKNLWAEFLFYFDMSNPDYSLGEPYASWREWAFQTTPSQWVASAFFWDTTFQGRCVWRDLDYCWLQWICRNNVQKSISDLNRKN